MSAFLLNLAIVALIVVSIAMTGNPLFILALLLLRDMPAYGAATMLALQGAQSTEAHGQPMGFTADLDD